jgi:uncharacterized protein YaiI (UPF0178 family)
MSNKQAESDKRVIVDGDGIAAPIIAVAELAQRYEVECLIVANELKKPLDSLENMWISVPVAPNSADTTILNIMREGDIVITDDWVLGWKCRDKGAIPLRGDGGIFDWAKDPMRFWRKQKLRALRDGEHERVKTITARLLVLRLANAIASSVSGASANEEDVLLAALIEINRMRISDSDMRAGKPLLRSRRCGMPEFGKKSNRRRKPEFNQKSRFMHPKRYVPDREREALREMKEISDEYETRFQISRRALLIETQRRKTALRSEPRDGHRKRRLHQKRTSAGIERCGRKTE